MGEYVVIEVGKVAPEPFWPSNAVDGAKLLQNSVSGEVLILIYLDNPTHEEIAMFRKNTIQVGCIAESNGNCLYLLKVANSDILLDLSHNPTLHPIEEKESRLEHWGTTNFYQLMLIDSSNGIIRVLRAFTAPDKLVQSLHTNMSLAFDMPDFTKQNNIFLDKLNKMPLETLWLICTVLGTFGE